MSAERSGDVGVDEGRNGRRGSIVGEQYQQGLRRPRGGGAPPEKPPTNEEVAKAVQQKVAAAVEMSRKYRHVAWYSLFVAAYMVVLYLQASAYKSGEVVETLKKAFMPEDGSTTMTFRNEDEVLEYLGQKVLLPIWKDPVCGDGNCEWPWEFPSWGRFGCQADCGQNTNTTPIVVNVRADFTGHPSISSRVLMNNAKWNLCLEDEARRKRGEADLCWSSNYVSIVDGSRVSFLHYTPFRRVPYRYDEDQAFKEVQVNSINAAQVIDGKWYVIVKGDYAGRVSGAIYDITNSSKPVAIPTSPSWDSCKLVRRRTVPATQAALRRLLAAYTQAHRVGGEGGRRIIAEVVDEISKMEGLKHINFTKYKTRMEQPQQQQPQQQPINASGTAAGAAAGGSSGVTVATANTA
ncbi:hypothetical protein VOLCADRAFT_95902 [Volvox carteri f. nagariensis]|uniref:Uncharacterized protein n=1 Tax=Volvox carteri f. nagariensis TaxID=3068 RepID=D8U8N9_VOLCA|nr:uncharacterized protein VOLCADRAFT_95902 [Volvox carteri f. nagariensis]EFJ43954.1 hypothetical protein VOLCADRAFT_95902 [Volvox carteri f. nagariensis]|eukprot:XP_002954966.1 hypothetical protein VOLCADRAFT_95902 [Volvox carteri f. nagariensis]